jgi:16S rRNA (uracil1498-N3)-methyltransferase
MARYDFRTPRLFVEVPLAAGTRVSLDRGQTNYLVNVLRLAPGRPVLLFNGRDGEWKAEVTEASRKAVVLGLIEQTRLQTAPTDLHYLFAPLKHARLDYMVQKAVEMGASRLHPVLTRHSQAERLNLVRMRANAIEAAEQCGILSLPEIATPTTFDRLIDDWPAERLLVFCDEDAKGADPIRSLDGAGRAGGPVSVLVGPEGGFAEQERAALARLPNVVRLSLGPRILRADTAAVAALALVQAVLGDWR